MTFFIPTFTKVFFIKMKLYKLKYYKQKITVGILLFVIVVNVWFEIFQIKIQSRVYFLYNFALIYIIIMGLFFLHIM